MKTMTQRKSWIALLALLFIFAACKGDTPTAPPSGGGSNGGGGTFPPAGVSLALTASNAEPVVDSTVVFTATVTQDGKPVPDGTAVEFATTAGTFGGDGTSIVKTTTNGVATVTLTSSAAGPATVRAIVNNVSKTVSVTFKSTPVDQPPTGTIPTITSISPTLGRPAGGEVIHITGTNFKTPVRVLFDVGQALPVEASVVSVTDTNIDVITPGVNLGAGQQLAANVIVITQSGTTAEQRVEKAGGFTYRNEQLTPHISTASPNSGPVTGGTRVTIFGDGFQAPVQVLFGAAEARVITVNYDEIIVESPAARDTSPNGSGTVTGPVAITIRNINSQTSTTMADGFRYTAALQITAVTPSEGLYSGGTRVSIDGIGFIAPVAVTIGGVAAQPISVTGTKVIAVTPALALTSCGDVSGPVTVTNIVNGDQASGGTFTYRVPKVLVIGVTPSNVTAGGNVDIAVANAQPGPTKITLGSRTVFPTSVTFNETTGVATFTVAVPTNYDFPTTACVASGVTGVKQMPITSDVTYTNVQTGCTDTAAGALTIQPTDTSCVVPPAATMVTSPSGSTCALLGSVAVGSSKSTSITVTNTAPAGSQSLSVSANLGTQTNGTFQLSPATATVAPGATATFTVTGSPTAAGAFGTSVTFTPSGGTPASVCVSGTGT